MIHGKDVTGVWSSARCSPEPKPVSDLLCEDPRPSLLHGGPLPGGHEDLDGCHSDGRRGLHPVHELRDQRVTGLETRAAPELEPKSTDGRLKRRMSCRKPEAFRLMRAASQQRCLYIQDFL